MTTEKWAFTCPECAGHNLTIEGRVTLKVTQRPETGEHETHHVHPILIDYCDDDWATCEDCDHKNKLKDFIQ